MAATVYVIEQQTSEAITKLLATRNLKRAYNLSLLNGRIADPSLSYKTVQRRLQTSSTVFLYDKVRFESEAEAIYNPLGTTIIITRLELK